MRITSRDSIAWTVLAAIVVVVVAYFAQQQATGSSATSDVYRVIVTPER